MDEFVNIDAEQRTFIIYNREEFLDHCGAIMSHDFLFMRLMFFFLAFVLETTLVLFFLETMKTVRLQTSCFLCCSSIVRECFVVSWYVFFMTGG